MSEKNTNDIASTTVEQASTKNEVHPVFTEKPQTREQIGLKAANDRIRILQ